jgi:hypothetical protein
MKKTTWFALLLSTALIGCATRTPVNYPAYPSVPTVAVSTGTLSTMTEVAARDRLLENSQVFVRAPASGGALQLFGVLGAVASMSIDSAKSGAAVEDVSKKLAVKFDKELNAALELAKSETAFKEKFEVLATDAKADLLLLPHAVFELGSTKETPLTFHIASRFMSYENKKQMKLYAYVGGKPRLFGGDEESWTENDNAQINKLSRVAFDRLTAVLFNDVAGKYQDLVSAEKPLLLSWQLATRSKGDGYVPKGIVLEETADYYVVIPLFQGKPATNFVLLMERDAIKVQPQ